MVVHIFSESFVFLVFFLKFGSIKLLLTHLYYDMIRLSKISSFLEMDSLTRLFTLEGLSQCELSSKFVLLTEDNYLPRLDRSHHSSEIGNHVLENFLLLFHVCLHGPQASNDLNRFSSLGDHPLLIASEDLYLVLVQLTGRVKLLRPSSS
jgi:hypothetical protein